MDLWIRSQDKKQLIKAEYINISSNGYRILVNGFDYGFYETSKRALEVLDEIDECMSNAVNNGLNVARYIMPEE